MVGAKIDYLFARLVTVFIMGYFPDTKVRKQTLPKPGVKVCVIGEDARAMCDCAHKKTALPLMTKFNQIYKQIQEWRMYK